MAGICGNIEKSTARWMIREDCPKVWRNIRIFLSMGRDIEEGVEILRPMREYEGRFGNMQEVLGI
jgi:hypothetical protein